jgi:hypothetical protein
MPSAAVKLPSLPPLLATSPPDTQAAIFWLRNRRRKQ